MNSFNSGRSNAHIVLPSPPVKAIVTTSRILPFPIRRIVNLGKSTWHPSITPTIQKQHDSIEEAPLPDDYLGQLRERYMSPHPLAYGSASAGWLSRRPSPPPPAPAAPAVRTAAPDACSRRTRLRSGSDAAAASLRDPATTRPLSRMRSVVCGNASRPTSNNSHCSSGSV